MYWNIKALRYGGEELSGESKLAVMKLGGKGYPSEHRLKVGLVRKASVAMRTN